MADSGGDLINPEPADDLSRSDITPLWLIFGDNLPIVSSIMMASQSRFSSVVKSGEIFTG